MNQILRRNFIFTLFLLNILWFEFLSAGNHRDTEHRTIYLNSGNESYKFEVLTENKSIKTDKHRTYYWFAFNSINSTMGGYSGKVLDGSYSCFYLSNTLKEKGVFKKGLKNGEWRSWNENGALKEIINYKHGIKCGLNEIYSNEGKLLFKKEYKDDLLNGKYRRYLFLHYNNREFHQRLLFHTATHEFEYSP